ncbi:MAG: six-hairpin glycosidase-like family protein [Symbiobacteriaceae bacterium]|nr:six-hairpin glycosidase-like family protein [Symbiobacteriaceae bacterium]
MAELIWLPGEMRLKGGGGLMRARSLVRVMVPGGVVGEVPVGGLRDPHTLHGAGSGFAATVHFTDKGLYQDVELRVTYTGAEPIDCGLQVAWEVVGDGAPTWLIPGIFYGENRLERCTRLYPRYDARGGRGADLVSDAWAFRADRAALPSVFGWTGSTCGALAVDEVSELGQAGIGFAGGRHGAELQINWPYRETPVLYAEPGKPLPADCPTVHWEPGEVVFLNYRIYVTGPDRHNYDPFVRAMYERDARVSLLNPWMAPAEAAELTAYGLWRWHFKEGDNILIETAAFDREGNHKGDRYNMHVGWVSGVPYAYAMLRHGKYAEAARAVLDKIASGVAPAGMFWGEWREGKGWSQGWTPNRGWIHTRTISEATLFMIRALVVEPDHANWREAVLSNLRYVTRMQREDGSFGTYYHAETGEVMEWDGAGGILWITALLEGAAMFGDEGFRDAAAKAGAYYASFVRDEFIYGAPEDVHLAPTSEDGYNAIIAYVSLYEAAQAGAVASGRQDEWLDLARRAADWTMTFRWTYNLDFPPRTFLKQFDFRSRGSDLASPSNQHLHNYGLVAFPEMLRLADYTGDRYYLERTRDNLACFLQFIAREDGDFNAYKGMVTERWYNTNCFQPKGMMLTLSHSWSIGLVLYACLEAKDRGFVLPSTGV